MTTNTLAPTTAPDPPADPMLGWYQRTLDEAKNMVTRAAAEQREFSEAEHAEHAKLLERAESMRDQIRRSRALQDGLGPDMRALLGGSSSPDADADGSGEFGSEARLDAAPNWMLTRQQMGELQDRYLTRAVTSVTAPQAGQIKYPTLPAGTFPVLRDAFRILNLIPVVSIEDGQGSQTRYYRGGTASNAKVVGEGGQKPLSDPNWTAHPIDPKKVAHYSDATEEALTDAAGFQNMLETELLMGVIDEENRQLISGDGSVVPGTGGTEMIGLLNTSGILTYAPASPEARIISIAKAQTLLQVGSSYANPDALIIHPSDFERVRLYQGTDNTFAAGFALGGDATSTTVWGMRAYATSRVPAGTALVGNLAQAAQVYVRMRPTVKIDPYSQSSLNIVRFIAEERLALAVVRPSALLKITFNGAL